MSVELHQFATEGEHQGPMRVLWVDDEGVRPDDLARFGYGANADITMAPTVEEAVAEWQKGGYTALVLDHDLGQGRFGFEVLNVVMEEREAVSVPSVVAVVSARLTEAEKSLYGWVATDCPGLIFDKRGDFAYMGLMVRGVFDQVQRAEGLSPS